MPHEIDKEALTAHLDGRGTPETATHVASCADCSSYVERVRKASALFRQHGKVPAPEPKKKAKWIKEVIAVFVTATLLIMASGMALKKFMPGLMAQIQGMISGAANEMGK